MKLFKKVSAIVMATAMFGMSAMAAGVITLDKEVTIASDATQVVFEIKVDEGTTMGAYAASFGLTYDTEVFTFNEEATTCGYGVIDNVDTDAGLVLWATTSNVTVTAEEDTLVSYVFDINENADPDGATFTISEADWMMSVDEEFSADLAMPANTTIKVVVEEAQEPEPPVTPEPPKPGDVIEVGDKKAVIDDAGNTRFVVEDTETNVGKTTAASVLKVTYDGTMKQANLWKLLKVDEGADGEVAIGNLTVKVILGTDVIDANSVGALSIAVQ